MGHTKNVMCKKREERGIERREEEESEREGHFTDPIKKLGI